MRRHVRYPQQSAWRRRDRPSSRGAPFRRSRAGGLAARPFQRLRGRSRHPSVPDRPEQPDILPDGRWTALCPAQEAAGQAAAVGPCGRSRISRNQRATGKRRSSAANLPAVRGRERHRHGLLPDGAGRRPGVSRCRDAGGIERGTARLFRRFRAHPGRAAQRGHRTGRPSQFRPAAGLSGAPGGPLGQAV